MTETRGLAYVHEMQRVRNRYPLPATYSGLWGEDGKLLAEYQCHEPAERVIRRFAERTNRAVKPEVLASLPPGVRQAFKLGIEYQQLRVKHPWAVKWIRVQDGHRRTGYKKFTSLGAAVLFWAKVKPQVPNATILSRVRSYDIPPSLRGRLPRGWYWCPRCMVPRHFVKDPERTFSTLKKVRQTDPQKAERNPFKWVERTVAYMNCPMCGITNRDPAWRRSNQIWEKRRIKRGVRRVKPRRRTV